MGRVAYNKLISRTRSEGEAQKTGGPVGKDAEPQTGDAIGSPPPAADPGFFPLAMSSPTRAESTLSASDASTPSTESESNGSQAGQQTDRTEEADTVDDAFREDLIGKESGATGEDVDFSGDYNVGWSPSLTPVSAPAASPPSPAEVGLATASAPPISDGEAATIPQLSSAVEGGGGASKSSSVPPTATALSGSEVGAAPPIAAEADETAAKPHGDQAKAALAPVGDAAEGPANSQASVDPTGKPGVPKLLRAPTQSVEQTEGKTAAAAITSNSNPESSAGAVTEVNGAEARVPPSGGPQVPGAEEKGLALPTALAPRSGVLYDLLGLETVFPVEEGGEEEGVVVLRGAALAQLRALGVASPRVPGVNKLGDGGAVVASEAEAVGLERLDSQCVRLLEKGDFIIAVKKLQAGLRAVIENKDVKSLDAVLVDLSTVVKENAGACDDGLKGALERVAEVLRQWTAVTEEKVRSQKALKLHKEEALETERRLRALKAATTGLEERAKASRATAEKVSAQSSAVLVEFLPRVYGRLRRITALSSSIASSAAKPA
jgi:hypothetical protein